MPRRHAFSDVSADLRGKNIPTPQTRSLFYHTGGEFTTAFRARLQSSPACHLLQGCATKALPSAYGAKGVSSATVSVWQFFLPSAARKLACRARLLCRESGEDEERS